MKRRYFYARVTRSTSDKQVEVVAGVEVKKGEPVARIYDETREILDQFHDDVLLAFSDQALAEEYERLIKAHWPDGRSYFLEIGHGAGDEYVQVYQE
jgi:hypothetical protein